MKLFVYNENSTGFFERMHMHQMSGWEFGNVEKQEICYVYQLFMLCILAYTVIISSSSCLLYYW